MGITDGFFVTGTDTEVGKTVASAALIKHLVTQGFDVVGLKPIASGFEPIDGQLQNLDVLSLTAASNVVLPPERVNRYGFEPPIAPHIAAEQQGVVIDANAIIDDIHVARTVADIVVVEGVGGWLVPLSSAYAGHDNIANLAKKAGLPVIMVVGLRLGCLNHALLTAEAIQASGVPFAGWVANHLLPEFSFSGEHLQTLSQLISAPLLFELPHLGGEQASPCLINPHSVLSVQRD
jgi:dethiobiotin synthetase